MKLVFEHTTGPMKGLHQILGDTCQILTGDKTMADLPALLPLTRPPAETIQASLVAVKRSYVLYRELIQPFKPNKDFHEAQR